MYIEQNQIYLNFIVNTWKLSNTYTRHRILTHFGNHRGGGGRLFEFEWEGLGVGGWGGGGRFFEAGRLLTFSAFRMDA